MPMLAIVAEVDPLTEHLVLLIIAVASAGVLLLIILLAVMFWGALVEITRPQAANLSGRRKATEPSQSPVGPVQNSFGDPD
jgi:hypothetical protein